MPIPARRITAIQGRLHPRTWSAPLPEAVSLLDQSTAVHCGSGWCPWARCRSRVARISVAGRCYSCGRCGYHEGEIIAHRAMVPEGDVAGPLGRLLVVLLEQDRPDKERDRSLVGEMPTTSAPRFISPLRRSKGWWGRFGAVLRGEAHVGEDVLLALVQKRGELRQLERTWSATWRHGALAASAWPWAATSVPGAQAEPRSADRPRLPSEVAPTGAGTGCAEQDLA